MTPDPADGTGQRWWTWGNQAIDLQAEPGATPPLVHIAVLARRDALTDEDTDMADFLEWLITDHPPWTGGCTSCRTTGQCTVQANAHQPVTSWLISRSQRMLANPRARNTHHARRPDS